METIGLLDVYQARGATELLYELLTERSTEDDRHINISHRRLPSFEEHRHFVESKPYRLWYLVWADAQFVGYVGATYRNEIGIVLFRAHRGKGYGKQALKVFLDTHEPLPPIPAERSGQWLANINPTNEASVRLFTDLGFSHIQNTYAL